MRINKLILSSLVLAYLIQIGCTTKWSKAIHYGKISTPVFDETVAIEVKKKLVFVPVTINGKEYLFLFDSGAPLSISEELQKEYSYNIVSKSNIVDSDQNKKKVNWVQFDSLKIGNVSFLKQSAFVGNFKSNPILKCLNIDGIIGSNIIRQCYWTIDQEKNQLSLSNSISKETIKNSITVPFKTDHQFNMFVNLNIGEALVKDILIDYGSNASVGINKEIFRKLKEKKIIQNASIEKGVKQTGIVGKPVKFNRELTITDSIKISNHMVNNVLLKTSKTTSIGNKFLSRFIVTIDWENKKFYLNKSKDTSHSNKSFGFKIGYTPEKGLYVLSVTENSDAQKQGVKTNMLVTKINDLDFENSNDFCDYVALKTENTLTVELVNLEGKRKIFTINKK